MKRFKLWTAAMVACMVALTPVSALAASDIGLQVNGTALSFSDDEPVIVGNRVYLPFRAVFEALDASVSIDEENTVITAVKNDTTVLLTIGDRNIVVQKGEETETVETDAASFISDNGTAYVPVRFAAQAVGSTVGWDNNAKTAVILDENLFTMEDVTFNTMNKAMDYSRSFTEKTQAIDGSMKFDLTVIDVIGDGESFSLPADIEISGVTDASAMNMDMVMKFDTSDFAELAEDEEDLELLALLDNVEMNMIFNMDNGDYFFAMPLMDQLSGSEDTTWMKMNFDELFGEFGFSFTDLMRLSFEAEDFSEIVAETITDIPVDNAAMTSAMVESYDALVALLSDQGLTQVGNEYKSSYVISEDDVTIKLDFSFVEENDVINGSGVDISMSAQGMGEVLSMSVNQKESTSDLTMKMNIIGFMSMEMDGTLNYTETTQTPVKAPQSNNVVDLLDLAGIL